MGTRADFYIGRGIEAEWLGSVAWGGDTMPESITGATSETDYRAAVAAEIAGRDDGTDPAQGWPWPWDTSYLTDYVYALDGGRVLACSFDSEWWPAADSEPDDLSKVGNAWPLYGGRDKATTFGPRSGVIILTS